MVLSKSFKPVRERFGANDVDSRSSSPGHAYKQHTPPPPPHTAPSTSHTMTPCHKWNVLITVFNFVSPPVYRRFSGAKLSTFIDDSSIMFHVRRRPADSQPRRRKKKAGGGARPGTEPLLVEVAPDGTALENGRRTRLTDVLEVGSGNGTGLQLYGPSIQPRHCVIAAAEGGGYNVTPLHTDAHVYVNGRRIMHTQRLQHGCLLKVGRVSTFRFVDPAQENLMNRNLVQSQNYGSGSIYDRSPTSPENSGAMSPTSLASHHAELDSNSNSNANATNETEYPGTVSPVSHDAYAYRDGNDTMSPYNNNTLKLDNESLMMSQHLNESKDDYMRDEPSGSAYNDQEQSAGTSRTGSQYKDNYETTFDLDGNVETKSICSAKSGGSGHDNRVSLSARPGQEAILPAVLEFPEAGQAQFLAAVITRLDPHAPAFKLAPVYTLYLCARYRASTHYRPELTPTERAHKLTAFLHHVATLIHATVQERCTDSAAQAFWMANASELLHFLKCDRHISSFSTQAQELLPQTVQNAFSNLVTCFQEELGRALVTLNSPSLPDATEATAPTLQALAAAMVLLRRCRVNAALTIQLFSHLFHYINAYCFNKLVLEPGTVSARWGAALSGRLALLAAWAERQGLELAADCHLARTHQAARLIQGEYRTAEEVRAALSACVKLNSVQVRALLAPIAPPELVEAAVAHARALADELYRADGREIRAEESRWLGAALLIPGDGFSAEVVRGVPPGLAEFVAPLQRGALCRLVHQPRALGAWSVYLAGHAPHAPHPRADARPLLVRLHKNSSGMGLSIVAAKGAGQNKLGIYIKSVVPGGAAAADGRLAAGDQLLSVDGHSLVGITQEKAAEYLVRTGPTVTLEVAKQGAVLHGLATLLHQPAYNQRQGGVGGVGGVGPAQCEEVQYEDRVRRNSGTYTNTHPALLKPASPLTELATAGTDDSLFGPLFYRYGRRPFHDRFNIRDESTESSTDDSEECHPHYHGSIPRLIITLDRENNQLQDDPSPETPGCPIELRGAPSPVRPVPVFTFTCEDYDEKQRKCDTGPHKTHTPQKPPPVPEPPAYYEQSSESGEAICIPPQMRPIDTKLTLELFNARAREAEGYRRRCTGLDECVSACECCRTPQPEAPRIPYIDEPNSEPVIFENDCADERVATPKVRRILPSLSLDRSEEKRTVDAECQTSSSPEHEGAATFSAESVPLPERKVELSLNLDGESRNIGAIHSRLKRTLFKMSNSYSSRSEDTEGPSTYSTSESFDDTMNRKCERINKVLPNIVKCDTKQILDSVDRKSWKSPDEFRPAFGKVKALTKRFNDINLTYSAKNYKRNCQSSPNLCIREEANTKLKDCLPISTSLADMLFDHDQTETSDTRDTKMSDDEVKSILIQLEDWSRYGSRGSEDTLAQGNEFELPNLPSEDHTDNASHSGSYIFNEIIEKKPRVITLDNIKLKSNQSSVTSDLTKPSQDSLAKSGSFERVTSSKTPKVVAMTPRKFASSLLDVSKGNCRDRSRDSYETVVQSCPNINNSSANNTTCPTGDLDTRCPDLKSQAHAQRETPCGAMRRASERDLPSRLAAEPVKPSKSTPALHHAAPAAAQPPPAHAQAHPAPHTGTLSPAGAQAGAAAWAGKSRSSHNLAAAAHPDAFYQNLSSVNAPHGAQDRWWNYRTGSRPQSAHFAAGGLESQPESSPHQQANTSSAANIRAAKLAEMSEEVTRRQQQQQMLSQQKQMTLPHPHTQLNQHPGQLAHQIGHSQHPSPMGHQANQLAHQQAQTPNQTSQPGYQSSQLDLQLNQLHQTSQPGHHMSAHGQYPGPMSQQAGQPGQLSQHLSQSQLHMQHQQPSPQPHHYMHAQNVQSPPSVYHNQHNQQQRYEWHPPGPPSPHRLQPPVAPKPQGARRSETEEEQLQQQLQHSQNTVQPEDERYVASALEPPAVSVYPAVGAGGGGGGGAGVGAGGGRQQPPPHNPWQREERERQAEARRAAARARRDATIAQLLALGASRTPVQNQQLRALQLERDFERRATQHDHEEGGGTEPCADEEYDSRSGSRSRTPSPDRVPQLHQPHQQYQQHQHQQYQPHQPHQPLQPQQQTQPPQPHQPHQPQQHPPQQIQQPPKSILKSNPRADITNGYATDTAAEESYMTELSDGVAGVSVSTAAPPAPPERGSSFAVMAGRRALSPAAYDAHAHAQAHAQGQAHTHAHAQAHATPAHAHAQAHATPAHAHALAPPAQPTHPVAPQSPLSTSRDKRVSFHERASASAPSPAPAPAPVNAAASAPAGTAPPPAPPTSSPPPLDPPQREDPDRFISEAESMLAGPSSPSAASASAAPAHTPGVIGAQEVYRDPRARRLAEQQARAPAAPVPEQLSFKEKMKMFALEAGDRSTPKDKVKISRAQRDIDAVH
ncbi:unnamed protein product, partial [Iphiclides podalirius]